MQLTVLTSSITEPVTVAEVKTFLNYPATETSQDTLIAGMITAAREFVENRTGLSIVAKQYKAYFEKEDAEDGYYVLPVEPVLSTPAITVTMNGTSTTFTQYGTNKVRILPDAVFSTMPIGSSGYTSYTEIIFQAGATNKTANECIKRIVAQLFNHREDGTELSIARLPFDTVRMLDNISVNL